MYAKPHQIKYQYKTEMSITEQIYWIILSLSGRFVSIWLAVKLPDITGLFNIKFNSLGCC